MRKRLQRPAFLRAVQPLNEFSKCCLASLEVDLLVCCVPGGHFDSGKRAIKSTEMHLVPFFHLTEIPLVPFSHLSKMTLVPFPRLSEMPSIFSQISRTILLLVVALHKSNPLFLSIAQEFSESGTKLL